ncbi:hypothetical protein C7445_101221 [Alicyclobacillus sacchari]|uniref:Peptidase MA-like domain-containing protein n=1 Tax=Alicyclobacillus sacchari TaxID=392010 RepID=A0A4V3HF31_9BACL|nr:hypothetical protein [Alicyclobacillus sacchari]TDY51221.1 hypothetical protein C7445_101221 [Alicyclobacillus sacchari]
MRKRIHRALWPALAAGIALAGIAFGSRSTSPTFSASLIHNRPGSIGAANLADRNPNASAQTADSSRVSYAYSPVPADSSMVRFEAFGSGVTNADIQRAEAILSRVHAVSRISNFLGLRMHKPATVYLVNNASSYAKLLKQIGVSDGDANNLSQDSNGFTLRSTVIIPLFQNTSDDDLANTLTHELTHVTINQNIASLPSWMNEGMAVYMGFNGQKAIEPQAEFEGDEREYAEDILDVVQSGSLVPLTNDEAAILSGSETYDYELQDWLAVCDLISKFGISSIAKLANNLTHENPDQAFQSAFGETVPSFNASFTKQLQAAVRAKTNGASLNITIPAGFQGSLQFLAPNRIKYEALNASPGNYNIKWKTNGGLASILPAATPLKNAQSPDPSSAYLWLTSSHKLVYQNKTVADCGFRFDYQFGLYAFESAWIDFTNGQVAYVTQPSLFGVTIQDVQEIGPSNPLLPILRAEWA